MPELAAADVMGRQFGQLASTFPNQREPPKHVPDGKRVPGQVFRDAKPDNLNLFGHVVEKANHLRDGHSPSRNSRKGVWSNVRHGEVEGAELGRVYNVK